jgi:hypothetical protein
MVRPLRRRGPVTIGESAANDLFLRVASEAGHGLTIHDFPKSACQGLRLLWSLPTILLHRLGRLRRSRQAVTLKTDCLMPSRSAWFHY